MRICRYSIFILIASLSLVACGVTGWGFSNASDFVQRERVGQRVVKVDFDETQVAGNLTLKIGKWNATKRFYSSENLGLGWRYFIVFRESADCRYSIFVDQNGLIKSWRDEGGKTHMNRCYVG